MNPWIILLLAGVLEVGWAIGLKYTDGFSRLIPSIATLALMAASMFLLSLAARELPIGTAYAVWVGIGAMGAAILGVVLFHEPVTFWRILFLTTLCASLVGLKLTSGA
jgi:quaternary ammonium compound-resistance protein SugE